MSEESNKAGFLFGFTCQVVRFAASTLAIKLLWNWFVVPLGAPTIHYAWAFGLQQLAGCFHSITIADKEAIRKGFTADTYESCLTLTIAWVMASGLSIAIGYLCHLGMP